MSVDRRMWNPFANMGSLPGNELVMVNGADEVYVERKGPLERAERRGGPTSVSSAAEGPGTDSRPVSRVILGQGEVGGVAGSRSSTSPGWSLRI
jgi:hypothetical protein